LLYTYVTNPLDSQTLKKPTEYYLIRLLVFNIKKHSTNSQHYKLKKKKVTAAHSLGTPEAYPIVERLLF